MSDMDKIINQMSEVNKQLKPILSNDAFLRGVSSATKVMEQAVSADSTEALKAQFSIIESLNISLENYNNYILDSFTRTIPNLDYILPKLEFNIPNIELPDINFDYFTLLKEKIELIDRLGKSNLYYSHLNNFDLTTNFQFQEMAINTSDEELPQEYSSSSLIVYSDIETRISSISSEYVRIYRGVLEAYNGTNPDKLRQFCISTRELFIKILNKMVSQKNFEKWYESLSKEFVNMHELKKDYNNKKSKLFCLFDTENHTSHELDLVLNKIKSLEIIMNYLNSVHKTKINPKMAKLIKDNMTSYLGFLFIE